MKIHFLGTAAAEGWPGIFCDCEPCLKARRLGGRNIRTRSSILVDGVLKVDLPPDTYHHVLAYGLELHKLRHLLITHAHSDHCCWGEIEYLNKVFRHPGCCETLEFFANREVLDRLARPQDWWWAELPVKFVELQSFQTVTAGEYEVTTLRARHGSDKHPLNYIIARDGKRFLYACDTGLYEPPTWEFLAKFADANRPLDLVISECTEGPRRADYGLHMGLPDVLEFKAKAESLGVTDASTRWILTHLSHHGGLMHEEMQDLVRPHGLEVAHDGMVVEV